VEINGKLPENSTNQLCIKLNYFAVLSDQQKKTINVFKIVVTCHRKIVFLK